MKIKTPGYTVIFALKMAIATAISYFLGMKIGAYSSPLPGEIGALWSVISANLVLKMGHLESFKLGLERIIGTFIGSFVGAVFLFFFHEGFWLLPSGIFLTVIICFFFSMENVYIPACLAIAVVMIIWEIGDQSNPWIYSLMRFLESALGVITALVIARIPPFKQT